MRFLLVALLLPASCAVQETQSGTVESRRSEARSPGPPEIGESGVVVLDEQGVLRPKVVLITSSTFDNDRFDLCFVPSDTGPSSDDRRLSLRFGRSLHPSNGWHAVEGEALGHFDFRDLDERQARLASKEFGAPIAFLKARPYELRPNFTLDQKTYSPREPVQLTLRAENIGDRAFSAHFGGWQRGANRHGRFEFKIVRDGKLVPDIGRTINFGGLSSAVAIEPHASFEDRVQLDQWCAFDEAGVYEVDVRFELHVTETKFDFEGGAHCSARANNLVDFIHGRVKVVVN